MALAPPRSRLRPPPLGLLLCSVLSLHIEALSACAHPSPEQVAPRPAPRCTDEPHRFLRGDQPAFAEALCRRLFANELADRSFVHGDVHLEQWAVTDQDYGLSDFDDVSDGPILFDLVRAGVSIALACEAHAKNACFSPAIRALWLGYQEGSQPTEARPPAPALVEAFRRSFRSSTEDFLRWVHQRQEPIAPARANLIRRRLLGALAQDPDFSSGRLTLRRIGRTHFGVGSAGDEKYLAHLGYSAGDHKRDLVVEIKALRRIAPLHCLRPVPGGAGGLIDAARHLSRPRIRAATGLALDGTSFWTHAWTPHFRELSLAGDRPGPTDLQAVARDLGFQLARGHHRGRQGKGSVSPTTGLAPDAPGPPARWTALIQDMVAFNAERHQDAQNSCGVPGSVPP